MLEFCFIFLIFYFIGSVCVIVSFLFLSLIWRFFNKMKKSFKQKFTDYINSLCDELRASIAHRKNKPKTPKLRKIGSLVIVFCTIIYILIGCFATRSSAAEVPTDLTGYTVTVPAGWTATAGYGSFDINTDLPNANDNTKFYIGYSVDLDVPDVFVASANSCGFYFSLYEFKSSSSFSFTVTGGVDVTNSSLIQWLVDNNATFVNNNAPASTTFNAGNYYFKGGQGITDVTIPFSTPFVSASQYFNSISISSNNSQYSSMSYTTVENVNIIVWDEQSLWDNSSVEYSVIYLQADIELSGDFATVFGEYFIPLSSDFDLNTIYNAGLSNGESFGYSNGYDTGYSEGFNIGYSDGFADGEVEGMADGFMGNFFGGIVQALDALTLFGDISVLNIIEGILGLMLALWVLKLIAGG